jgi:hypothetical protein
MNKQKSKLRTKGDVERIIQYRDGSEEVYCHPNTILNTGRRALAFSLANKINDPFDFYIARMLFGDGGTLNGVKKFVDNGRNGLFGVTRVSKPVIATMNVNIPTQVTFTSTIKFDEAVGMVLNEMALQLSTGDLYSMTTFPDLNKTEEMQIVFNWKINFI